MLAVSISLGLLALAFGAVGAREIPALLDLRLLELFFVLILAAVLLAGGLAAVVTNDVALLLVVPSSLRSRS